MINPVPCIRTRNAELGSRARALITSKTQVSKTGDLLGLPHLLIVIRDATYLKMFSKCDTYFPWR